MIIGNLWRKFTQLEKNFHLGKATLIIAVFTLLSRLTGFARDLFLASQLGASAQTDIYFTAFRIPDFIYNLLILGTLSAAFIPVFTRQYIQDKTQAWQMANSVLNIALITMGVLTLIIFIFTKPLVSLLIPGFTPEMITETVTLTRIFLLSPLLFTISSVFSSTLISFKKFLWVNIAPLFYNLGIILGIIFFWPIWGLNGLAFGVIIGALMHGVVQLPQLIALGFRWQPKIKLSSSVKQTIKLFLPRVLGLDISYVNLVIVSVLGSTLTFGTISAFNFATNIQTVPLGIFAISTSLAVFPLLSEQFAKKQYSLFIQSFNQAFVRILFFILPIAVLMLLLRAHIVRLLLGYGACDWTCTITTFDALGLLSISLVAQSLVPLLSRAFYARQNTITPLIISLVSMTTNALISYWLSFSLGIIGIALGFVIASFLQLFLLMLTLHHSLQKELTSLKIIKENDQYIMTGSSKIIFSAIVSGLIAYGLLYTVAELVNTRTVIGILIQSIIAGSGGIISYLYITVKLQIPDAVKIKTALYRTTSFFNITNLQ